MSDLAIRFCFDGAYPADVCCDPQHSDYRRCWQAGAFNEHHKKQCCSGPALALAAEIQERIASTSASETLSRCLAVGHFDRTAFMPQGTPDHLKKLATSHQDDEVRRAYSYGHALTGGRCAEAALMEDEDQVVLGLHDQLKAKVHMTGWTVNFGAGSYEDPFWILAQQRNSSGIFVDPTGVPKDLSVPPKVRFLAEAAEPDNVLPLLRRGGLPAGHGRRVDVDFLKVDVDGCDCVLAAVALRFIRPKIVWMEINWSLPPPLRFARQCHPEWRPSWIRWAQGGRYLSTHGCSLSAAVAEVQAFGYQLLRVSGNVNAVFVHQSEAEFVGGAGVDEVACFSETWGNDYGRYAHWSLIDDWRRGLVHVALQRSWCNLTLHDWMFGISHLPFSLSV
ncbi:unnamed protein product [Effrenium voratum]|uniref:Uncharacterized protein n=1 Tax=Effrenium voratum TaxID=2562239 RepID=A0AA36I6T1_9DINO|nr:unnamed protein product [Effrenium voratum]CAJ1381787.1 unnamed protein product [Effrenium voratum]CAJ1431421.1 unnamed protein product [Effrenium voratum]